MNPTRILIGLMLLSTLLVTAGCPYQRMYNADTFEPRFIDQPRVVRDTVTLTVFPTELTEPPREADVEQTYEPKIEKSTITADGRETYWPCEIVRRYDSQYGWTQSIVFDVQGDPQTLHITLMVQHISGRFRMTADMARNEEGLWEATFQETIRTQ
jgi:hypothetical protein